MRDDLARIADEDESPQKGLAVERLRAAWERRRWLAVVIFALPFVAAVSAIFSLPTFYRSTALVLIDRQQVPEAFVRPTVTSELETRLQSISQEALSRARLENLISQFGLYPGLRKQAESEEVVERMRKDIKLELRSTLSKDGRPSATTAFALSYQGPDAQTVAAVTNALVSFYIEENLKARTRQATGTADFLKTQLADTRRRLDDLETRVTDFRRRNLGELPQQMPANLVAMENLNTQLRLNSDSQVRATERLNSLTALLAEASTSPQALGATPGAPPIGEPRSVRLVRLRQELAAARSRYTEQHPSVARLKAELAATEAEAPETAEDKAADNLVASPYVLRLRESLHAAESEIKVLKAEEQRLRGAIATYQARLENTPKREQEFQDLSRDYESTKQLYDSLSKRHEEAQLAESMEQRQKGEQFRILDQALPSLIPAAPNRLRLLVVSLVLSLGLAGGAVMLAELFDTSFHSVHELRQFTTVPVVASIPRIVTESDRRQRKEHFRLAATGVMLGLILVAGASYFIGHGNEQLVQVLSRDGG